MYALLLKPNKNRTERRVIMTLGNIIGIIFVTAIILAIISYFVTHAKWVIKLIIGLVLAYIVLGILADPNGLIAIGWFVFSAICFVVGIALINFIRKL